jgi:arylsulfatase
LQALFDSEARRNNVYPLAPLRAPLPSPRDGKTSFIYREGVSRSPLPAAPRFIVAHTITADASVPAGGAQGVIIASGGRLGGFSLFAKNGYVIYEYNAFGVAHDRIVAPHPLAAGDAHIVFEFTPSLGPDALPDVFARHPEAGSGRLFINGEPASSVNFAHFAGASYETLDIGQDLGTAVSAEYSVPFAFTGKIETVKVDLKK